MVCIFYESTRDWLLQLQWAIETPHCWATENARTSVWNARAVESWLYVVDGFILASALLHLKCDQASETCRDMGVCPSGIQGTETRERHDYVSLCMRHDLFKGWITLSKVIQWIMQSFSLIVICWVVIYPVACITGEIHIFCVFRESESKSEEGEEHQTRAALAFVRLKNAQQ